MRYKDLVERKCQQALNQLTGIHSAASRGDGRQTRELIEGTKERIEEILTLLNNEHQE
jgi:hypothetical protein